MEGRLTHLVGAGLVAVAAALCFTLFLESAGRVISFPWDWSPDEGLYVDYAMRMAHAPAMLYPPDAVPLPDLYGPVTPLLLLAMLDRPEGPLPAARVMATVWTALIALGVYVLARRAGGWHAGLIAAALALAPMRITFWYLIVRPDGPMVALWVWAAVLLVPRRLERGSETLATGRMLAGSALLVVAVLTKLPAVLHGAPLVLGWLMVDRRSAFRLIGTMIAFGLLALTALTILSDGRYWFAMSLWGEHGNSSIMLWSHVVFTARALLPLLLLVAAGAAVSGWLGLRPWRDGSVLLLLGGLAIVPTLGKVGAMPNYMLPLVCALAVAAGRLAGGLAPRLQLAHSALGTLACTVLVLTHPFLTPTPADLASNGALYQTIAQHVAQRGGPILAVRPDYAYFVARQHVDAEGSSITLLLRRQVRGTEKVIRGLESATYTAAVVMPRFTPPGEHLATALVAHYRVVATCTHGAFYGTMPVVILVPRDARSTLDVPGATGCEQPRR